MTESTSWTAHDISLDDVYTNDGVMQACLDRARLAAATDLPILILGESGPGKTLLARAIHNSSRRAARPFVSFNAAALSDTLLDSQLFGHEAGAFTGAQKRVKGKFEQADGGTLFIDEIADLSPSGQSKILRAVEYGEFERLGAETLLRADVRLISATHLPLQHFTTTGQFREDLFFRINGIMLAVPPLRDRRGDLRALMASEIATAASAQHKKIDGLDREAADCLLNYAWPGNLRELHKVLNAAVALTSTSSIGVNALLLQPASPTANGDHRTAASSPSLRDNPQLLRTVVHRHIQHVLDEVGGNKRKAARHLGVSRATLERKIREIANSDDGSETMPLGAKRVQAVARPVAMHTYDEPPSIAKDQQIRPSSV